MNVAKMYSMLEDQTIPKIFVLSFWHQIHRLFLKQVPYRRQLWEMEKIFGFLEVTFYQKIGRDGVGRKPSSEENSTSNCQEWTVHLISKWALDLKKIWAIFRMLLTLRELRLANMHHRPENELFEKKVCLFSELRTHFFELSNTLNSFCLKHFGNMFCLTSVTSQEYFGMLWPILRLFGSILSKNIFSHFPELHDSFMNDKLMFRRSVLM